MTYSHDGYGMGHLRRNLNIATRFVQSDSASNALMVVGSYSGGYLEPSPGIDFIKIPSIIKVGAGVYEPFSLRNSVERTKALRSGAIRQAAEAFDPHIFLADHVPAGVWDELVPTLEMFRRKADPPAVLLGMRDIVDSPELVRKQWAEEGTYELVNRYYDEVLIYGCPLLFDTARQYGLSGRLTCGVRYCGYVCSEAASQDPSVVRQQLGVAGGERLVLVTGGGGGDAYPMMQVALEAFRSLGSGAGLKFVLIAGPLMPPEQKESLQAQAEGLNGRVLSHVYDNLSYLNAADLVVTMGGYNTLAEILRLRKKALVLPRRGPRAEQIMRAQLFAQHRLMDYLHPADLTAAKLRDRMMAGLKQEDMSTCHPIMEMTGSRNAVSQLIRCGAKQSCAAA